MATAGAAAAAAAASGAAAAAPGVPAAARLLRELQVGLRSPCVAHGFSWYSYYAGLVLRCRLSGSAPVLHFPSTAPVQHMPCVDSGLVLYWGVLVVYSVLFLCCHYPGTVLVWISGCG